MISAGVTLFAAFCKVKENELQQQIDELDEEQLEQVIQFLKDDVKAKTEEHH